MELSLDALEATRDGAGPVGDIALEIRARVPIHDLKLFPDGAATPPGAQNAELSLDRTRLMRGITADPSESPADQMPDSWVNSYELSTPFRDAWWSVDLDRSQWPPVSVPGSVQPARLIAEPLDGSKARAELERFREPADQPWHSRRKRTERQDWWLSATSRCRPIGTTPRGATAL